MGCGLHSKVPVPERGESQSTEGTDQLELALTSTRCRVELGFGKTRPWMNSGDSCDSEKAVVGAIPQIAVMIASV